MLTVRFFLEQAVVLGTVAFGFIMIASRIINGPDISVTAVVDILVGLITSWLFVLAFIVVIAAPIQFAVRRFRAEKRIEILAGAASGIVAVAILVAVLGSGKGNSWGILLLVTPMALVGGWFATSFRRHLGPN